MLEAADLKKEIERIAMKATHMPITFRDGAAREIYVVIDGGARGKHGADDHEIYSIMKSIEKEMEVTDHPVERLYNTSKNKEREDDERPRALQVYSKNSSGRYPVLRVRFVKKSVPRPKIDGDPKEEYTEYKIVSRHNKPGESNELHLVNLLNLKIEAAGGVLKELTFDGYTNDKTFRVENVVSVRWIGNKNGKADVLLVNEDGEITRVSLKQRNFFEIHAGEDFYTRNEDGVQEIIDQAIDTAQVEIDEEGKFSKRKHFELAAKLTKGEAKDAYFGKNNNTVEVVVIETFLASDFKLLGTKLTVKCDYVFTSIDDVHDRLWPYMAINSDFEKSTKYARPVRGKTFLNIVPRFRLKTHARKTTKYPKTLIVSR